MNFKFAIITPSYAPDYHRCSLLCQTMDAYGRGKFTHYVIVDKKDYGLFKSLASAHRHIITVESVLPWWIVKSPFSNGWFSLKSIPLRNWIVQQLVKLAIANIIDEEILIFVDSDVAFIKSFNFNNFVRDDRIRFFREPKVVSVRSKLGKWSQVSTNLLKIPPVSFPTANYLGNFIF